MTKSPEAFRTISEVADELDLPQHVLRFWETRFSQIKPLKRGGGRRYYRPEDVELLIGIQHLLYDEGYTIKGVQRILKEYGNKHVIAAGRGEAPASIGNVASSSSTNSPEEPPLAPPADTAKQAIPVNEFIATENRGKKSKSLFNRKTAGTQKADSTPTAANLSPTERKLLQATLYDLLECKRLLDQGR